MTRFLVSVRDVAETETALAAGADIIDLKDPAKGALGALDPAAIASCVTRIAGRAEVSATVGDLPMRAATIRGAVRKIAALGVDHVKLGLFPEGDAERCLVCSPSRRSACRSSSSSLPTRCRLLTQ